MAGPPCLSASRLQGRQSRGRRRRCQDVNKKNNPSPPPPPSPPLTNPSHPSRCAAGGPERLPCWRSWIQPFKGPDCCVWERNVLLLLFSVFFFPSLFNIYTSGARGCEGGVLPSKETLQCEVTKGTDIRYLVLVLRPSPEAEARAHADTHTHTYTREGTMYGGGERGS